MTVTSRDNVVILHFRVPETGKYTLTTNIASNGYSIYNCTDRETLWIEKGGTDYDFEIPGYEFEAGKLYEISIVADPITGSPMTALLTKDDDSATE